MRQPFTEDERQRQIAQLEAKRDSLLQQPFSFVHRWLVLFLFVAFTIGFLASLFAFLADLLKAVSSWDWSPLLEVPRPLLWDWPLLFQYIYGLPILGVGAALSGGGCWVMWIEESPRAIQARIDALRAQSVHETKH
jgi:hypothetical protein